MRNDNQLSRSPVIDSPRRFPFVLWTKYWRESWLLLVSLAAVLFLLEWLRVWMTGQVNLGALGTFLRAMPPAFERLAGVPVAAIATPTGRIAMGYVDPVLMLCAVAWSIARGSDCVSGEIGRGTMEMLLAQPLRRWSIIAMHAMVTTLGCVLLAVSCWLGTWIGVRWFASAAEVDAMLFVPAALNLFGLMFFLAGVGTLVSAFDNQRWRTIGILGGFYVAESLLKVVARVKPEFGWLMNLTFLGLYEPQVLVLTAADAWRQCGVYLAWLVGLGSLAYIAGIIVFSRRELPAPS